MIQSVPNLLRKISKHRPRMVCFLGKGIWQIFINEAIRPPERTSTPVLLSSRFFASTSLPGPSSPGTPSIVSRYFSKGLNSTPPTISPYFKGLHTPPATPPNSQVRKRPLTPTSLEESESEDEEDPDVLPSFDSEPKLRRRKRMKAVYSAKQLSACGWGLQPFKVVHPCPESKDGQTTLRFLSICMLLILLTTGINESLFFVMPSTSARVVSHQVKPSSTIQSIRRSVLTFSE